MPNAQATDEKPYQPSSPGVMVYGKIPTTEPNGTKSVTFAPTLPKKDSDFSDQFDVRVPTTSDVRKGARKESKVWFKDSQTEERGPPLVPSGGQNVSPRELNSGS